MELLQKRIEPDVEELLSVIKRRSPGRRVHHLELFLDEAIKQQICSRFNIGADINPSDPFVQQKRDIAMHRFLGYDVCRTGLRTTDIFSLPRMSTADTAGVANQPSATRSWSDEHIGPIQSWQDFESYAWPKVSGLDFSYMEWIEKNMPADMGCYELTAHILEVVTWLLGYETLCYKMCDEADLVEAICQRVGDFYVEFTRTLCSFPSVRFVWGSDDLGFRTSTLVSRQFLQKNIFPWHKRCAQIAHEHNKPYLLHSCGKIDEVMDDLIDDVGIDAKHSFEDTIMPVTEFKKLYGTRTAVLGGIDVDFLCRADEKAIRKRVRETLETCMPGGGYCLGTGNSVANYIPVENYLIMLDEGRKFTL